MPLFFFIWIKVCPGDSVSQLNNLLGLLSTGISAKISIEQVEPASGIALKQLINFSISIAGLLFWYSKSIKIGGASLMGFSYSLLSDVLLPPTVFSLSLPFPSAAPYQPLELAPLPPSPSIACNNSQSL